MGPEKPTIGRAWRAARDRLDAVSGTAALDARLLARHVLDLDETGLIMAEADPFPDTARQRYEAAIARRLAGEPVARILGRQEFFGLDFALGPDTLVPRPETELLVEFGLALLADRPGAAILDLGTGTGCIALALLANLPDARAVGIDRSPGAVTQARANARALGLADRFEAREGNWFDPLAGHETFDFIVSNPPYIAPSVIETLSPEVRDFDPRAALDGGPDGLAAYREIVSGAGRFLAPGAVLAVEIGFDQADMVTKLFTGHGYGGIALARDLSGHPRVVSGVLKGP